jgi:uncharacterized protein (DUF488 family)
VRTADVPALTTIGHGRRTTDELATLLRAGGVATVIDVRRYPLGRRQPHLARERLAADLPARGLAYEWWGDELGGRRDAPDPTFQSRWRSPGFVAYAAYMGTPTFRTALATLERRARSGERLAVMCAETLWWRCHRRLIADALTGDGYVVRDVIDTPEGTLHPATSPTG